MKKYFWLAVILVAVIGSTALQSNAQTTLGLRGEVPFDFTVGDKTFQAGKIAVRGVSASETGTVSITSLNGNQNIRRIGRKLTSTDASNEAKLVFHKYGSRYYLAQVWVPGYKAWSVEKSKSEKAAQREIASNAKPEVVTVVAAME